MASDTRKTLIRLFLDLEGSGLPVDRRVRDLSRPYLRRLGEFTELLASAGIPGMPGFAEIEAELYRMRGEDIVDNPPFGKLRMLFYNVRDFHHDPKPRARALAEKHYAEFTEELRDGGYAALSVFLGWLVEDMKRGSAILRG